MARGVKAYSGAFTLIRELGLWKYFAVPILISIVTFVLIGLSAYGLSDPIGGGIARVWIWDWGAETVRNISNVVGGIAIVILGIITYKHIILALSAPFMSPVSEKIERHLLGRDHLHRNTTNTAQLWRGIRINVRNFLMEILFTVPLLILSLIPILNFVTGIVIFLIQSYYAGFGNMDYTLERHLTYRDSTQFVRNNSGIAIGNGLVFMGMLLLPVIGIILVLPLSVTASTTATLRLLDENKRLKTA